VHDLGVLPDGRPFLAMKLIKGETLEDLLQRRADPRDKVAVHGSHSLGTDRVFFKKVAELLCSHPV
jgi:hypothetical protein